MKNVLQIIGAAIIGLLIAFSLFTFSSVPEVYADSSEISYADGGQLPLWAVKEVKDSKGASLPRSQWKEVLAGRYTMIPVDPSWQPSEKIQ